MSSVNPLSLVSYTDVKLLYETEYIWIYTRFYCFHTFKTKINVNILWKKIHIFMLNVALTTLGWFVPHCTCSRVQVVGCQVNLNLTIHVINDFLHKIMIFTYRNFTNWNLLLLVLGKMILFIDRYQNIWCSTTQPPNGLLWPEGHVYFFKRVRIHVYRIMFEL